MRRNRCRWTLALAFLGAAFLASCAQDVKITSPRYALVYGVQDYPGNLKDLLYTVNDSNAMATLLADQGWVVTKKNDSNATQAAIEADFASLNGIPPDSTVLFYFSGHGALFGNEASIAPYDSIVPSNVGSINESYSIDMSKLITPTILSSLVADLPNSRVLVIFDTCNSGGFVSTGSAIDASPQDYWQMPSYSALGTAFANFGDLLSANASASGKREPIVISAAGLDESSYDGTGAMAHGVFTYYLLESAISGDTNGDGIVTATEAFAYAVDKVQTWGRTQAANGYPGGYPFLPHISGGVWDLALFTR
jgi:hypothetical protein